MAPRTWQERVRRPLLDDEALADCLVAALEERLGGVGYRITGPRDVELALPDGTTGQLGLDNLLARVAQCRGEDRVRAVREFADAVAEAVADSLGLRDTPEPGLERVVPLVRDAGFVASAPAGPGGGLVAEPLVADLYVVYAFDQPRALRYSTHQDLARLGLVAGPALRERALDNLRERLEDVGEEGDDACGRLVAGGVFEASLLLVDDLWDALEPIVEGTLVVSVPARDVLLYTGSAVPGGLRSLRAARDHVLAVGDHLVSETLLARVDGRWERFDATH
jgi:uncharacterized protein YtpQ (UPF0354 family)